MTTLTADGPKVPSSFTFNSADNRPLFIIKPDGTIVRGEGFTTEDEMSLIFWDCIAQAFPQWQKQQAAIAADRGRQHEAEQQGLDGLQEDLDQFIRVALTNPGDLRGFIQANYPRESARYAVSELSHTQPAPQPNAEVVEALRKATQHYFNNYMQDEAADENYCVCGEEQHQAAKEVQLALAAMQSQGGGE